MGRLKNYNNFLKMEIKNLENETDEFNVQIGDHSKIMVYKASQKKLYELIPELKNYKKKFK